VLVDNGAVKIWQNQVATGSTGEWDIFYMQTANGGPIAGNVDGYWGIVMNYTLSAARAAQSRRPGSIVHPRNSPRDRDRGDVNVRTASRTNADNAARASAAGVLRVSRGWARVRACTGRRRF
jgi:hypothetical protein